MNMIENIREQITPKGDGNFPFTFSIFFTFGELENR